VVNNVQVSGAFLQEAKPKENSKITFQSLQEGEVFDRDIQRIMAIINGVEKQFCERKVTKDFQSALQSAYKTRVLQVDHDLTVS